MSKSIVSTVAETMQNVRSLLQQGKPEQALNVVNSARLTSPEMDNARGVCLMRMGNLEQATQHFRHLVFRSGVGLAPDAPADYKVNYATALLLSGNLPGCNTVLNEVYEKAHPGMQQLKAAIRRWKQSLSFGQRLTMLIGVQPSTPVTLDYAPGIV